MLKSIDYTSTFPSTGRSLSGQFAFEKGMTAISGGNERGKSFLLEIIQYALFGTSALRGRADVTCSLEFAVKGIDYLVERGSRTQISSAGAILAVGVKPTNQKIIAILGFNLDVFRIACVANQGDLERLGSMRPSALFPV